MLSPRRDDLLRALADEHGAVTAEFAVALPGVVVLVATILSVGQWQVQQARLLVAAATIARAEARGESPELGRAWARGLGARLEVSFGSDLVCARLSQPSALPIVQKTLEVSEKQCAQKQ